MYKFDQYLGHRLQVCYFFQILLVRSRKQKSLQLVVIVGSCSTGTTRYRGVLFLLCVRKINIESVLPKDELAPKFYRIFYLTQNSNGVRKLNLASNVSTHSTHSKLARCAKLDARMNFLGRYAHTRTEDSSVSIYCSTFSVSSFEPI